MKMVRGISGKFFRALAEANVNIRAIAQGSSERSISAVISQKRVNEAVAFAHTAFFNSKQRLDLVLIGCGGVGGARTRSVPGGLGGWVGRLSWGSVGRQSFLGLGTRK